MYVAWQGELNWNGIEVVVCAALGARKGSDWWAVNKDCSNPASRLKGRHRGERAQEGRQEKEEQEHTMYSWIGLLWEYFACLHLIPFPSQLFMMDSTASRSSTIKSPLFRLASSSHINTSYSLTPIYFTPLTFFILQFMYHIFLT